MEGDFHARGRQHFSVMNVYECINVANDNNMLLNIVEESLTVNKDIKSGV
jgi:hypothetical protein